MAGSVCQYCSTSLTGQVRAVAGGDEGRQAQPTLGGHGQERDAERAGLAEEADPTGQGHVRGQRGVQPDLRVGVRDTRAPSGRPPASHGRGPLLTSRRCAVEPSGPASAKPPLSTTSALTPLARQESRTPPIPAAGTATTARSTSLGNVGDRRIRVDTTDGAGVGVDRVHRACEVAVTAGAAAPRGRSWWSRWKRRSRRPSVGAARCARCGPRRAARGSRGPPWTARSGRCRTRDAVPPRRSRG